MKHNDAPIKFIPTFIGISAIPSHNAFFISVKSKKRVADFISERQRLFFKIIIRP